MQSVVPAQKHNSKRTIVLLAVAGALLIGALVWRVALESRSLSSRIVRSLSEHGLTVDAASLYQHEHRKDTSIAQMMEGTELSGAVAASKAAGFPADIDRAGEVYCILANMDSGVLTLFVVDEEIELAFIQLPGSDEVIPITGEKAD